MISWSSHWDTAIKIVKLVTFSISYCIHVIWCCYYTVYMSPMIRLPIQPLLLRFILTSHVMILCFYKANCVPVGMTLGNVRNKSALFDLYYRHFLMFFNFYVFPERFLVKLDSEIVSELLKNYDKFSLSCLLPEHILNS